MKYKDQTVAPDIVIPSSVEVPSFTEVRTPEGGKLYHVDVSDLDLLRISVVFRAGVRYQTHPFTASATVNMLAEGTASSTSAELAEMLDYYGMYYNVSIDRDYSIVTVCCLNRFLDKALSLLSEILTEPLFPDDELAIYSSKRKQSLIVDRTKVDVMASELFWRSVYGEDHPYGRSSSEDGYDTLTGDMLRRFFRDHYNLENSFTVVSGKIESGFIERISEVVDRLPHGTRSFNCLPAPHSVRVASADKPDALQAAIRMGRVLFKSDHPDYVTMQVVSTVLGGYFSSRLVQNLREDKGYTYGAWSQVGCMEDSGYIAVATQVAAEHARDAVREIFREMERLRTEPVPSEELDMVKSVMIGEMMRILDGPFGICDVVIENVQNGADNGRIKKIVEEINRTTPEDVMKAASLYLRKEDITTVTVGGI